jgi:hypothetical protein
MLSPNDKSSFSSLSEEKLKILDFKAQKGMLTLVETEHLAMLRGGGGSTGDVACGSGPTDWGPGQDRKL